MRIQVGHRRLLLLSAGVAALMVWPQIGNAQPTPPPPPPMSQQVLEDITNTKHNLSSVNPQQLLSSGVLPRPGTARDAKSATGGTSEICVFCHTPHGASAIGAEFRAPLWNRNVDYQSTRTYQLYDQVWSFSFEGTINDAAGRRPTGYSRLCLSCHDGTVALGNVINAPGSGGYMDRIPMTGNLGAGGTIPTGSGDLTGDTRRLGLDLRNDHPISFVFDPALVAQDQELVNPGEPLHAPANKVSDPTPISPMRRYPGSDPKTYDSVQCTSCHNPHQVNFPKFLRGNWFHQEINNPDPTKNHPTEPIICLRCHEKPRWIDSTHAISTAIRSQYPLVNNDPSDPNSGYDFDGSHTVSELACRNCHDPHTIQGAKRLHREGVNAQGTDGIEATCYLCHAPNTASTAPGALVAGDPTSGANPRFVPGTGRAAPDVYGEFFKDAGVGNCAEFPRCGSAMNLQFSQGHEPVFTARSQEGVELDSPSPPANNEASPGIGMRDPAHIECVDCHNPHQVVRENRLRGIKGITFDTKVIETTPGNLNRPYVYEVCFRCHGNSYYNIFNGDRYPDDIQYSLGDIMFSFRSNPRVPTSNPRISLSGFSNKRLEFATYGDKSNERAHASGPGQSYVDGPPWPSGPPGSIVGPGVHKAFHPVVAGGRNGTAALTNQLRAWSRGRAANEITIQCTDCHNNDYYNAYRSGTYASSGPDRFSDLVQHDRFRGPITESNTVRPGDVTNPGIAQDYSGERSQHPIGPHGSKYSRILRAPYNTDIASPSRNFREDGFDRDHWNHFLLCFQCHDRNAFDPHLNPTGVFDHTLTNFFGVPADPDDEADPLRSPQLSWEANLHMYHLQRTGAMCHECHYNVHSNVQGQNTIFGDGTGCIGGTPGCPAGLPPDNEDGVVDGISDTHLINFAPPGPTLYSGARRCDTGGTVPYEDAGCEYPLVGNPPTVNPIAKHPNPSNTGDLDPPFPDPTRNDQERFNVFKAVTSFNGVEGVTADRPVWYYTETVDDKDPLQRPFGVFRCNLRCHGVVMSTCFYIGNANREVRNMNVRSRDQFGNLASGTWCAGGRDQIAPISTGSAAPPEIQKLLADFRTAQGQVLNFVRLSGSGSGLEF